MSLRCGVELTRRDGLRVGVGRALPGALEPRVGVIGTLFGARLILVSVIGALLGGRFVLVRLAGALLGIGFVGGGLLRALAGGGFERVGLFGALAGGSLGRFDFVLHVANRLCRGSGLGFQALALGLERCDLVAKRLRINDELPKQLDVREPTRPIGSDTHTQPSSTKTRVRHDLDLLDDVPERAPS